MKKALLLGGLFIFVIACAVVPAHAAGTLGIGFPLNDSTNYTPKSYALLLQGDGSITVTISCDRIGELEMNMSDKFGNELARGQNEGGKAVMRLANAGVGTVYVNVRGKYDLQYRYNILATQVGARSPADDEFAPAHPVITVNAQGGGHLGYRYYDKNYTDDRDVYQLKIPSAGVLTVKTGGDSTLAYRVELHNPNGDLYKSVDSANGVAEFSYNFGPGDADKTYSLHFVLLSGYGTYGLTTSYSGSQASAPAPAPQPTAGPTGNLALNRPANQSSTYTGTGVDQGAHLAVDGITSGRDPHDLIMTTNQNNPWWMVDLGRVAAIEEVRLYNRKNPDIATCLNIEVLVSSDGANWSKIYAHNNTRWEVLTITANAQARYVKVQLPTYGAITLYEVEVIGR